MLTAPQDPRPSTRSATAQLSPAPLGPHTCAPTDVRRVRRRKVYGEGRSPPPGAGAVVSAALPRPGPRPPRGRAATARPVHPGPRRRSNGPCGSRGSSVSRVPVHASRSSPRCGSHWRRVPSKVKPSFQATRRDAQLPTLASQITVARSFSPKPQSSNSRSARSTWPVPRTHGCEP